MLCYLLNHLYWIFVLIETWRFLLIWLYVPLVSLLGFSHYTMLKVTVRLTNKNASIMTLNLSLTFTMTYVVLGSSLLSTPNQWSSYTDCPSDHLHSRIPCAPFFASIENQAICISLKQFWTTNNFFFGTERRPVSNGYMSLQRPPSSGKITKLSGEDVRSEPDGGAYYTDYRKKDYRIPLTSVSSHSCLQQDSLNN